MAPKQAEAALKSVTAEVPSTKAVVVANTKEVDTVTAPAPAPATALAQTSAPASTPTLVQAKEEKAPAPTPSPSTIADTKLVSTPPPAKVSSVPTRSLAKALGPIGTATEPPTVEKAVIDLAPKAAPSQATAQPRAASDFTTAKVASPFVSSPGQNALTFENSRAAQLVPGAVAKARPQAEATTKPKSAAKPSSAAAVFGTTPAPATAVQRLAETGSVMCRGAGAKAEPPAASKANAKATPAGSTAGSAAPDRGAMRGYQAAEEAPLVAHEKVIDIVSRPPVPALEAATASATPATMGPARTYAKQAAPLIACVNSGAKQVNVLPKEGPAVVAVGRAVANGSAKITAANGSHKANVSIEKKMQIIFVTSELAPYSKTGGLGEAMDGLPIALAALGHRVMVISPRYDQYADAWDTGFWSEVTMGGHAEPVHFFHSYKQKVDQVFVDHPAFLERVQGLSGSKLYGPEWGKDFADNQPRYAYFCKAALLAIQELPLGGHTYGEKSVVISNDWHSALVPMLISAEREVHPQRWANVKTAFLCHNAVFQGRFALEPDLAHTIGVPEKYIKSITFQMPLKVGKEHPKVTCVNTMAAALLYADQAITVSPYYAVECAEDEEKGCELEKLFAAAKVTGILNGVKEGVSPSDPLFVQKTMMQCGVFSAANVDMAKDILKAEYRATSGLPPSKGPLMCFVGRLDLQKGYDLLLEALTYVLEDTDLQVVIVGAGRGDFVTLTQAMQEKYPTKFYYAGWMGPERYALVGGSDYTLLPSRWEPCGLVQMEAMRLGTLPIVAPTGGLRDTVEDSVTGLWTDTLMDVESKINPENVESLCKALRRAVELHINEPTKVHEMRVAAMAAGAEFTWSNAALQYESLFDKMGVVDVLPLAKDAMVTLEVDKQVC